MSISITEKHRIAFAYDGNDDSHKLFDWIIKNIIKPETGHLILLSVIHKMQRHPSEKADPTKKHLQEIADQLRTKSISSETHILWGDAKTQLPCYTQSHKVNLLIMGSRGLSMVKSVFLGSISETCLKEFACPVLVVRNATI